ncbi:hypothetical protein ABW20_dc0101443 [Dactylellina cionopaga]|nr:hypothetical protein ABW20_dc0101443 [Dactylellina cionopaga]
MELFPVSPSNLIPQAAADKWRIYPGCKPALVYPMQPDSDNSSLAPVPTPKPASHLGINQTTAGSCIRAIEDYEEQMLLLRRRIGPGLHPSAGDLQELQYHLSGLLKDISVIVPKDLLSATGPWKDLLEQLEKSIKAIPRIEPRWNKHNPATFTKQIMYDNLLNVTNMKLHQFKDMIQGHNFEIKTEMQEIKDVLSELIIQDLNVFENSSVHGIKQNCKMSPKVAPAAAIDSTTSACAITNPIQDDAPISVTTVLTPQMNRILADAMMSPIGVIHSKSIQIGPVDKNDIIAKAFMQLNRQFRKEKWELQQQKLKGHNPQAEQPAQSRRPVRPRVQGQVQKFAVGMASKAMNTFSSFNRQWNRLNAPALNARGH